VTVSRMYTSPWCLLSHRMQPYACFLSTVDDGAEKKEGEEGEAAAEPAAKRARAVSLALLDRRNAGVVMSQKQLRSFAAQVARDVVHDERMARATGPVVQWVQRARAVPQREQLIVPASEVQIV
jgi:hypothetical protein